MALRRSNQRQGFSLIELLVVIAIIAVLLALLVTGVQKVREASKRVACMNNMRQIGAGFHSYHQVNKELPTEARDNPSFYKQLLPFVEEQNASDSTQVNLYLCPSRRDGAVGPHRDYGYASSTAAGNHGPSILDQDMDSKASKAVGVSLETINSYNGASSITLLTHVWMSPSSYGTDASRWADKDNSRTNVAAKFDKDSSGDSTYLGGPHPQTTPTLFVDGHVENVAYASTQWADYWAYLTQDSSGDGAQGRWVRVWHPGSGDATGSSSSGGSAATSGSSSAAGNPIGPVNSSSATQVTGGNGIKQDTTNGTSTVLIPQTSYGSPNNQNSPSSRTSSDSTNDPNKSRDQQYQDQVNNEAARQAALAAQQKQSAANAAKLAKDAAAAAQKAATQAQGDVGKVPAAKQAQAQQLANQAQTAADQAKASADQAQTASQNPDPNSASQAANQAYQSAYNSQQAAQSYLNQVDSLIQQPSTTTTTTATTTPTTTTTTSSTPTTTTTTTTTNTNTNTSTTATNNTSTSGGSGGGSTSSGGSGNDGWYSWVFIPW